MQGNSPPFAPSVLVYRESRLHSGLRRLLDGFVAAVALIVSSPVIALAILAILIEDGRPVFFRQRRAGRFERLFVIWKLRTMRTSDCEDRRSPNSAADARVTRVGRILRRFSIDELPQLYNVLRGDMALVGPRPEMPFIVKRYEGWQHLRHLVRPGLTCLWQVELRSTVPLDRPEATALDIQYIRSACLQLDGLLIARTFVALVRPKGAF
jgi:lipopolysaccharide/colanic/teichoic acid biosynthesis glycosyltransferase